MAEMEVTEEKLVKARESITVALDVDSIDKATELVEQLSPHVGRFKIGLQFIYSILAQLLTGDEETAVENLKKVRKLFELLKDKLFIDGKFDDIPNTIAGATEAAVKLGANWFNIHASCGIAAMEEAVAKKGNALVFAVTVLTSLEENNAHLIFGAPSKAKVLQFARDAKLAGVNGIICSAQELPILTSQKELEGLIWATPGIRPAWAVAGDQKRIVTPADAVKMSALPIIGRPITKPPEEIGTPVDAAKKITQEIAEALMEMEVK